MDKFLCMRVFVEVVKLGSFVGVVDVMLMLVFVVIWCIVYLEV